MKHIGFLAPTAYRYFHRQGFGGAELQVVQQARLLMQSGYKVTILTNDYGQPDEEIFENIHLVKAPLRFLGGSNRYFFIDTLRFIFKVRRLHLDWCLLRNPGTALFQLGLARLFSRQMKICKCFASEFDCCPGRNISHILYRLGLKMSDKFAFQTHAQQDLAAKKLHISGELLPNLFLPPNEEYPTGKDIDILWVGAFDRWKRPDRLLEIAARLPQYKFTVISKPLRKNQEYIKDQLLKLSNADFVGAVPFEDTQSYFNRARLYLLTSETEGFPNTVLQAFFARCPVLSVTFHCGGILERYESGRISGSVEQSVKDIDELLQNDKLRTEMGQNGYDYLLQNHLPDKVLPIIESIIN